LMLYPIVFIDITELALCQSLTNIATTQTIHT
jgi:hypothetical protein